MNCWEYMNCGREAGGWRERSMGRCPAYPQFGKRCAFVANTLCAGKVQGMSADKLKMCSACEFYRSEHYERRSAR